MHNLGREDSEAQPSCGHVNVELGSDTKHRNQVEKWDQKAKKACIY